MTVGWLRKGIQFDKGYFKPGLDASKRSPPHIHHQRLLIPKHPDLLLAPRPGLFPQRQIKLPQQSREDEPHLVVRQVPADAVARAVAEGLVDVALVVEEVGGWVGGGGGEPAFGEEVGGAVPVEGRVEGGELGDADFGLWAGWLAWRDSFVLWLEECDLRPEGPSLLRLASCGPVVSAET